MPKRKQQPAPRQPLYWWALGILAATILWNIAAPSLLNIFFQPSATQGTTVAYNAMRDNMQSVEQVTFVQQRDGQYTQAYGRFSNPVDVTLPDGTIATVQSFNTTIPPGGMVATLEAIEANASDTVVSRVDRDATPWWAALLFRLLPLPFLMALFAWRVNRQRDASA